MADASDTTASGPDLGGHREGHPERLDRDEHGKTLIEAEHVGRYRWIAGQAKGRRVLDAGCGTGYGTQILAAAGAAEVVGLDRADDVLDAIRERMPDNVRLVSGDLLDIPLEDGNFDLVVCFEVIEHLEDTEGGLDELARILAPDGLLAVSSPNRDVFPPGNPHHVHEFVPAELSESLQRRFENTQLFRQHAWTASAILDDESLAANVDALTVPHTVKTGAIEPGAEIFTVGLASNADIPDSENLVVLGPPVDQRGLMEEARTAEAQRRMLEEQQAKLAAMAGARQRLVDLEQQLAELPALRASRIELAALKSSPSWRLTAPLRLLKARLLRFAPPARMQLKRALATFLHKLRGLGR